MLPKSNASANEGDAAVEKDKGDGASDSGESVQVVSAPPPNKSSTPNTPATTRASSRRISARRSAASATNQSADTSSSSVANLDSNGPAAGTRRSRATSNTQNTKTSSTSAATESPKETDKMAMDQTLIPSPQASPSKQVVQSNGQENHDTREGGNDDARSASPVTSGLNGKSSEAKADIDGDEGERGLGEKDEEEQDEMGGDLAGTQSMEGVVEQKEHPEEEAVEEESEEEEQRSDRENEDADAQHQAGDNVVEPTTLEGDQTVGDMGDDEGDSDEDDEDDDEDDEEDSEEDEEDDEDGERSTSLGAEEETTKASQDLQGNSSHPSTALSQASRHTSGEPNSQQVPAHSQVIESNAMEGVQYTDQGQALKHPASFAAKPSNPLKRPLEGGGTDGGSASEATGAENAVDENGQPVPKKKKGKPRPILSPTPPPEPPRPRPTVRLSLKSQIPRSIDPILAPDSGDLAKFPYILPIPTLAYDKLKAEGNDWADWWAMQQRLRAMDLEHEGAGVAATGLTGINGANGIVEGGPSTSSMAPGQAPAADLPADLTPEERAFLLKYQEGPAKKKKKRNDADGHYDVTDPFVDDSELALDEPTHAGRTTIRGFYVFSGDVELETVATARKKRADAGMPRGGLAGGAPIDGVDDSPSSTPTHMQRVQPKMTEEQIKAKEISRAKALEEERIIQRTTDLGIRSRMDPIKAADSLVREHVNKFGITSTIGSSMSGSSSQYTSNYRTSPTSSRSPSKPLRTPSSSSNRRESVGTKASPIVLDEDGDVATRSVEQPPALSLPPAQAGDAPSPAPPSTSSAPQPPAETGSTPVLIPPGYVLPTWAAGKASKHPIAPIPLRMEAAYEKLRDKIAQATFAPGKFPPVLKGPLVEVAKLALELGIYDDEHLFHYFPIIFPYNKLTTKKLTKRDFCETHWAYYETVKETILGDFKAVLMTALPAQQEQFAKAEAAYKSGQAQRDALKEEKAKQKEARENKRKTEISAALARKDEFPPGYWEKYPQGKWKDEDCIDEPQMIAILQQERLEAKDAPPLKRWSWTEEQRFMLAASIALCDAQVELRNEKAAWENSSLKASQITVRKQLYNKFAECWPSSEGWVNSTGVSKEFAVAKRRADKQLPQEFKDKEEKEKEKGKAEKESAAGNSSSVTAAPAV